MSYGVRSAGSGGGGGGWNARGRTTLPPPEPSRCTTTLRRVLARARGIADAKTGAGPIECPLPVPPRALSSVGRALPLQGNGRRFESCSAHRPRTFGVGFNSGHGACPGGRFARCVVPPAAVQTPRRLRTIQSSGHDYGTCGFDLYQELTAPTGSAGPSPDTSPRRPR
jgi:hypothetical protein